MEREDRMASLQENGDLLLSGMPNLSLRPESRSLEPPVSQPGKRKGDGQPLQVSQWRIKTSVSPNSEFLLHEIIRLSAAIPLKKILTSVYGLYTSWPDNVGPKAPDLSTL